MWPPSGHLHSSVGLGGKLYPVDGGRRIGGHRQSMGSAAQWEGNKDVSLDFYHEEWFGAQWG